MGYWCWWLKPINSENGLRSYNVGDLQGTVHHSPVKYHPRELVTCEWAWVWRESSGGWEPHVLSPDRAVVFLLLVFRTWMANLACYFLWTPPGHTLCTTLSNIGSAVPQLSWLHVAYSGTALPWVSEIHGQSKGKLEEHTRESKGEQARGSSLSARLQPPSDWRQECQAFMEAS